MTKPHKHELTQAQLGVLRYMILHRKVHGLPPTVREICCEFGWGSPNAAWVHLVHLRNKGCLAWTTGKARTFTVLPKGRRLARASENGSTR